MKWFCLIGWKIKVALLIGWNLWKLSYHWLENQSLSSDWLAEFVDYEISVLIEFSLPIGWHLWTLSSDWLNTICSLCLIEISVLIGWQLCYLSSDWLAELGARPWEERDANAGDDEVDHIEEGLAPQVNIEVDVGVGLLQIHNNRVEWFSTFCDFRHWTQCGRTGIFFGVQFQKIGTFAMRACGACFLTWTKEKYLKNWVSQF